MVKLLYKGKMAAGIVKGIGGVEKGKVYDVSEPLLSELLKNGGWERVSAPAPVKKSKFVFDKEEKFDDEVGGK